MKQITFAIVAWLLFPPLSSYAFAASPAQAMDVLSRADSREAQFRQAIRDSTRLPTAEKLVLLNQLRLRLAAVQMKGGRMNQARETLREVDTASPAAPQASLLMAESYRLSGQPNAARDWFLRAAHHYPYRPVTLEGLISAAHDEQKQNPGVAAALYSEIDKQSRYALGQLDQLQHAGRVDPMDIIFPSRLDDAVRKTVLRRALRHPQHNLLEQTGQLRESVSAMLTLQQRHKTLNRELNALVQQLADYQQQRIALQQQWERGQQQATALTEQLIPNDFSNEQMAIRQTLTRLRNQLTRQQSRLAFIEQIQQTLPAITRKLEMQLQNLNDTARSQLQNSHAAVTQVLDETLAQYRTILIHMLAESQLQRSELLLLSQGRH